MAAVRSAKHGTAVTAAVAVAAVLVMVLIMASPAQAQQVPPDVCRARCANFYSQCVASCRGSSTFVLICNNSCSKNYNSCLPACRRK